jgi:hypothetical protein
MIEYMRIQNNDSKEHKIFEKNQKEQIYAKMGADY